METQELIEHARRISSGLGANTAASGYAQADAFLRSCGTVGRPFLETLRLYQPGSKATGDVAHHTNSVLVGFAAHLEAGLHEKVSPERRAQLDVVSDFLEQANELLETQQVHPAAPAVLIGATLEEFLRTWVEAENLSLGNRKPGLDAYTQVLYSAELITKQDVKDITSWGGIRNDAAHGEWDKVSDKKRVALMLGGVNLFMRTYSEGAPST